MTTELPSKHLLTPNVVNGIPFFRRINWWPWITLVMVLIIVVGIIFFMRRTSNTPKDILTDLSIPEEKKNNTTKDQSFQAVFLDNGQVYFGKLLEQNNAFYRLENVFYFKQNSSPGTEKKQPDSPLVKLGLEVHGPKDFMEISKAHILFIEDLRADSQVLKAIEEYQNKK